VSERVWVPIIAHLLKLCKKFPEIIDQSHLNGKIKNKKNKTKPNQTKPTLQLLDLRSLACNE